MLERIEDIDTGAIEELARIKRDQELLEDRLRLMQERKEGVSEVVFERVRGDYRSRLADLDEQARPHKERARAEFGKLQALESEIRQARDGARLEKEELEFRHSLGEYPDGEFERQSAELSERLDQREVELGGVEALRERFFASVRSREDLEQPTVAPAMAGDLPPGLPAPPVPLAAAASSAGGPAEGEPIGTGPATAGTDVTPVAAAAPDELELTPAGGPDAAARDLDAGRTSLLAAHGGADPTDGGSRWDAAGPDRTADADDWHEAPTGGFQVAPPPPPTATAAPAPEEEVEEDEGELSGATRILARPRLVERGDGDGSREHILGLGRTSIGRASDNLVHLLDEAVSRHHAEIVPGPNGYLLRDLGSENGILVNGERTPEHLLHDGDVIQIGARTLVYRGA